MTRVEPIYGERVTNGQTARILCHDSIRHLPARPAAVDARHAIRVRIPTKRGWFDPREASLLGPFFNVDAPEFARLKSRPAVWRPCIRLPFALGQTRRI